MKCAECNVSITPQEVFCPDCKEKLVEKGEFVERLQEELSKDKENPDLRTFETI